MFLALVSATLFLSCQKDPAGPKPVKINYHCATMTEGRERILANTDVEHQDNYATFTIGGEKRNCALLSLYTATWEEAYAEVGDKARFFDYHETVLIPIDTPDTWYSTDDASDFWDVMGKNTDYIDGAEECMADNFSFAVVPNPDKTYKSPWLIEKIIDLLTLFGVKANEFSLPAGDSLLLEI